MFDRFSPAAREALSVASTEATDFGATWIRPIHLVLGLLHDRESIAGRALGMAGLNLTRVRRVLSSKRKTAYRRGRLHSALR